MHTNILGTYNLLLNTNLFIKESGANLKFIHISTDEVFGSLKDFESHLLKNLPIILTLRILPLKPLQIT